MLRSFRSSPAKGFTLLEITIVLIVLSILLTIGGLLFLRQKISANETAAQANLYTFRYAMEGYRNLNNGFPAVLTELSAGPVNFLDASLTDGSHQGYSFVLSNATQTTYTLTASPQTQGITGVRSFRVTEFGEIQPVS